MVRGFYWANAGGFCRKGLTVIGIAGITVISDRILFRWRWLRYLLGESRNAIAITFKLDLLGRKFIVAFWLGDGCALG